MFFLFICLRCGLGLFTVEVTDEIPLYNFSLGCGLGLFLVEVTDEKAFCNF